MLDLCLTVAGCILAAAGLVTGVAVWTAPMGSETDRGFRVDYCDAGDVNTAGKGEQLKLSSRACTRIPPIRTA
jgi:hypothetical protein